MLGFSDFESFTKSYMQFGLWPWRTHAFIQEHYPTAISKLMKDLHDHCGIMD